MYKTSFHGDHFYSGDSCAEEGANIRDDGQQGPAGLHERDPVVATARPSQRHPLPRLIHPGQRAQHRAGAGGRRRPGQDDQTL